MARKIEAFTDRHLQALSKPGYHADGGGLYVHVSESRTKSWIYRYTVDGRRREMGLGSILLTKSNLC
jgi:hypothetical protein